MDQNTLQKSQNPELELEQLLHKTYTITIKTFNNRLELERGGDINISDLVYCLLGEVLKIYRTALQEPQNPQK